MSLANVGPFNPVNYAESPTGLLFMATGLGNMFKWDGLATTTIGVGVVAPPDAPVAAWSGSGTITGSYTAYLRFVDKDGNFSNVSPVSNTATASNNATITYTGLDLPTETKVTRRQILRNTNGQATTYYVDIDTTDITSASLTSTNTDAQLTALTAVPSTNLSLYGLPPSHKWALAHHLGRMFAAVEVNYDQGNVKVVNGSTAVTIIGGQVSSSATGRFLYVTGATQAYKITATPSQTALTISPAYADVSDNFGSYGIRPAPTERRLIYFSQANLPESWPATNAISVQEDGDEITGLMPFGSFLYVLEQRHVYRFTFQTDPIADGFIYLSLNRGCINQRCWVTVEGTAYMLDEQGIHAYSGARDSEPISSTIQDVFRFSDSAFRVNWAASKWFHAVHFSSQEVIRWFVALSGAYLPYHAVCYNYRQKRWWVEEWAANIGASVAGRLGKITKTPQVYLGTTAGRIIAMWQGTLDGPDPTMGTVRGAVTSATFAGLTDTIASFVDWRSYPVSIVDGTGKGQQRIIQEVTSASLTTTQPWLIQPDTTSVYQIGGIQWRVQFGWWRTLLYEELNERYFAVVVEPCRAPTLATMRMFTDFSPIPTVWRGDWTLNDGNGVRTVQGSPDVVLDLTRPTGYLRKRLPGHREFFTDGLRYISFQLSGVTNTDAQRVYYVMGGGMDQGG